MQPIRMFNFVRFKDDTGISGTGLIAKGVIWPDNHVTLYWIDTETRADWKHMKDLIRVHGHGGKTKAFWILEQDMPQGWDEYQEVEICCHCGNAISPNKEVYAQRKLPNGQRVLSPLHSYWRQEDIEATFCAVCVTLEDFKLVVKEEAVA